MNMFVQKMFNIFAEKKPTFKFNYLLIIFFLFHKKKHLGFQLKKISFKTNRLNFSCVENVGKNEF